MKRLFILAAAILLIAAMVIPSAAASGPVEAAGGQKLVCINFDDGWKNQYDNALPVLQLHGFKATFAVVTTWVGEGSGNGECMDYTELHALAGQGMEIASHTRTHAHLPALGATDLQNEVTGSKTDLEGQGFTVRTLVYPYYEYNDSVIAAAKTAGYVCARSGALDDPYDPADRSDPDAQYEIDAVEISTQDLNIFKGIVDQASDRSVICLNYHSISNAGLPTPCTPVANFGEQMLYLKNNGFTIALLPDLVQSPIIACSPSSMTFSGIQGGGVPAAQTLNISNSGGGALTWTASSDSAWLTPSPAGGAAPSMVTVTANTTGLSAGAYSGSITVAAADAANTPQTVTVTLNVQTPSSGWLYGWGYRKQITIAGSTSGAQTDYPMRLTINRSTGVDSGATVYLGTRCAGDYSDIRFTNFDGSTLLDYWIESSTSSSATVWVELDSIPASPGAATFNLYYGNSWATSASNIQNTFTFADDFDDGLLDAARWSTGGGTGGTVTEAGGLLTVTAGASNQKWAASINTYNNAYALHTRAMLDSITGCSSYRLIGFVTTRGNYADKLYTAAHRWYTGEAAFSAVSGDGAGATRPDMLVPADTGFHVSECRRYASGGVNYDRFIMDGGPAVIGTKPTATARYIYLNSDEYDKAVILDWIFLRKFASIEPTWAGWGSEETRETPESPIIYFTPAGLAFSGTQDGGNPSAQTLNINNAGGGALTWTASSGSAWLTLSSSDGVAPSTVTVSADITGLSAGTYNGAITISAAGATNTPQTVPVILTVSYVKPGAPVLATPAKGAKISGASCNFTWSAGTGYPEAYQLQVNANSAFTGASYYDAQVSNTYALVTTLPNNYKTLYWRVRAYNPAGWSPWTAARSFFNGSVPAAPTLSSPAAGAKIAATSYTFTWAAGAGSPTKYQLQVNTATSFSGTSYFNSQVTGVSKLVTTLPNNYKTLYWRVRAYNPAGWGPWTAARSFFNGKVPSAPTLTAPANGATVSGASYTFKWAAGAGKPTKYQLQINSNSSFTGTSYFNAQVSATSKLVTTLPKNSAKLYWRVRAYNPAGWGAWSTVRNFISKP